MKEHKLLIAGITGILISCIYIGLLYQSGEIMNATISTRTPDWNASASYFVNPISFALGIFCLAAALTCCAIDIIIAYRKHKK